MALALEILELIFDRNICVCVYLIEIIPLKQMRYGLTFRLLEKTFVTRNF